jgi:AraC family transcriptional regulator
MKPRTSQDYHKRIARVIKTILARPGDDHSVERLAGTACMSVFHFHRVYRAMTGESIAETVRRVRLAQAARMLGETNEAVTSIAFDAGYDSPQAFSRAFRQFAGVSPTSFQEQRSFLMRPGEAASVRIVDVPAAFALALRHEGPVETIAQTWHRLGTMFERVMPAEAMRGRVGISIGDPEGGDSFTYHAGILTGPSAPFFPGLTQVAMAGGCYASYRLVGSYGLITATYRALFGGWLPGSGFECGDRPALEFYRSPWAQGDRADCMTDIMIPIKEP